MRIMQINRRGKTQLSKAFLPKTHFTSLTR